MMKNFDGFGLTPALGQSLAQMNYKEPTPIQTQAIPFALKGRDILGSAQTGTGKTAAYGIPLVEMLLRSSQGTALVLTPTRELANQVMEVIHQLLGRSSDIKTAFIIGGEAMGKQLSQLRARPRIIVGTPGRINDHLERGTLMLNECGFLVLDETDRMLDMGFGVQLDRILKFLPEKRQTLMFSATLPQGIVKLSEKYLSNPERVSMGETNIIAPKIHQEVIRIEQDKKYNELMVQLQARPGPVHVFVKTKYGADRMAKNLRRDGFTSDALHGDLRQHKRERVMNNFRKMNFRILIATDIAARGLDVPHIEHVVNYDLPQVAEDYIHRMGRTARAGANGSAISFISDQDGRKWHAIECLLDPDKAAENRKKQRKNTKTFKKGRAEKHGKSANDSNPEKYAKSSPAPAGKKKSGNWKNAKPGNSGKPVKSGKPGKKPSNSGKPAGARKGSGGKPHFKGKAPHKKAA